VRKKPAGIGVPEILDGVRRLGGVLNLVRRHGRIGVFRYLGWKRWSR
jgi:hypothetical protein